MTDRRLTEIQCKFLSGNNVPVESARLTFDEFDYLMQLINKGRSRKFCAKTMPIPDSVNREAWQEWCDYRSNILKKPVSEYAAKKQLKLLSQYPPDVQEQMIDHSSSNDYQGLFPPKGGNNGTENRSRRNTTAPNERETNVERVRRRTHEWAQRNGLHDPGAGGPTG